MKNNKLLTTILISMGLLFLVGGYFYNEYYHDKVRNSPKMYVYETYSGPPNPVLIIEDLQYKTHYIAYYESMAKEPTTDISFDFPLKTLPQYDPVYVMGYSKDSLLVDVVSYYNRGNYFGGSYLRCWVYKKVLHKHPPFN